HNVIAHIVQTPINRYCGMCLPAQSRLARASGFAKAPP
ncbi:unnamed protein product, partial [marine sediment metagenome]